MTCLDRQLTPAIPLPDLWMKMLPMTGYARPSRALGKEESLVCRIGLPADHIVVPFNDMAGEKRNNNSTFEHVHLGFSNSYQLAAPQSPSHTRHGYLFTERQLLQLLSIRIQRTTGPTTSASSWRRHIRQRYRNGQNLPRAFMTCSEAIASPTCVLRALHFGSSHWQPW
jgi:hypothetical protein